MVGEVGVVQKVTLACSFGRGDILACSLGRGDIFACSFTPGLDDRSPPLVDDDGNGVATSCLVCCLMLDPDDFPFSRTVD